MTDLFATSTDLAAGYRLVFGRDPDPSGFAAHLSALHKDPWTTRQLHTMLLNSNEYLRGTGSYELVDIGGVFAYVNTQEPEFGRHIANIKTWEPHIVETITSNLSPGQVFIDVGANVGIMSFKAAQVVGAEGKVIGFEPNEENSRCFLRGVLANGFQGFVRLYNFALSDRSDLFALEGISNTHLIRPEDGIRLTQSVRGDELLAAEQAVHFIKLDIEGHEPFAMKGLADTIRRHRPMILCEFNPRCLKDHIGIPPDDFADQIFELTREIRVLEYDGKATTLDDARALTKMWALKNEEAVQTGLLPDGMLHFDLLFRTVD